jgi:hypothetical protein
MLTIIVILAIWLVLSIPLSVVLGFSFRDDNTLDLVGMDGDDIVFRRPSGDLERVPMFDRTAA